MLRVSIPAKLLKEESKAVMSNMTLDNAHEYIEAVDRYAFTFDEQDRPIIQRLMKRMLNENCSLVLYRIY